MAALAAFREAAARCAATMHESATFIRRELPNVRTSAPNADAVKNVCEFLAGTCFDIRTELFELAELVADGTMEAVPTRVERIHRWLGEGLPECDRVVMLLDDAMREDPNLGGAYVLVAESIANVLVAYGDVTRAREGYERACSE